MQNKQYFLETYNDGWLKSFVIGNCIFCFGFTNFFISVKKCGSLVTGKYNFKYDEIFCVRFGIGQILYIKEKL